MLMYTLGIVKIRTLCAIYYWRKTFYVYVCYVTRYVFNVFLANVNFRYMLLSCPSSVCLSVTLVRSTQPVEIFGNVSMPFGTLAVLW